jgi:Na+/H+ antiporter NhaC
MDLIKKNFFYILPVVLIGFLAYLFFSFKGTM